MKETLSEIKIGIETEIIGNFVQCGKLPPRDYPNDKNEEWIHSLVKLSEIKLIHDDYYENSKLRKGCVFFTYKDHWYICSLSKYELCEAINNNLKQQGCCNHEEHSA